MALAKWAKTDLDFYRQLTDPEVDRLVAELLPQQGSESIGRLGYNAMLMLADKLLETPELSMVDDSRLSRQLQQMPEDLLDYFDPMEVPDWVDVDKLNLGAQLWQDNTLVMLVTLYAASLPACYLMKNGIPALYKTEKLRDQQYIFQRIYETGLMLTETMDKDGIKVILDSDFTDDKLYLQALQNLDAEGHWQHRNHSLCRTATTPPPDIDSRRIEQEIQRLRGQAKRYIWGKGYIAAKKVRFLHASMRFMLTNPASCPPCGNKQNPESLFEVMSQRDSPWDKSKYGAPINQEDLAYTLLTFGLLLPRGLQHWGLPISREQQQAFLHLWRLIGHIMGVHADLLTDDWDEAEALFEKIQQRQAGQSQEGKILTRALMGFLGEYLPDAPGIAHRLSAAMIISQLGEKNAGYLLDEDLIAETTCFWRKPIYALGGALFKSYLHLREKYYRRFRHIGRITMQRFHEASELLIDSWRDAYSRKPFFVPADATTWVRKRGVNAQFLEKLQRWRRRLFTGFAITLGFMLLSVFSLAGIVPAALFWGWTGMQTALWLAASAWFSAMGILHFWLPEIFQKRPVIEEK